VIPAVFKSGRALRFSALLAGAVLISLGIFALVPLLLRQTSSTDFPRASYALLIPIRPELPPDPMRTEPEPEPPEPPKPPEPRTEAELPDIPEIAPPEVEPPETALETLEMPPLEMPTLKPPELDPPTLQTPAIQALALSSLPAQSSPLNLKVNLRVGKAPPPQLASKAGVSEKPGMAGTRFGLHEVDQKPVSLAALKPDYPLRAKRMGIEGYVTVQFVVNRERKTQDLRIWDAEPKGVVDQTVRSSVPRWRFKPGKKAGRPVDTWVEMTIRFELGHDG